MDELKALLDVVVALSTPQNLSFLFSHLCFVCLNVGVMIAFFDRFHLIREFTEREQHTLYMRALMCSCFGIVSTAAVLLLTDWPRYGWKLWFGEVPSENNRWFKLVSEGREANQHAKYYAGRKQVGANNDITPAGRFISIWREV